MWVILLVLFLSGSHGCQTSLFIKFDFSMLPLLYGWIHGGNATDISVINHDTLKMGDVLTDTIVPSSLINIHQRFILTDCNQRLSFSVAMCTMDNSVDHDYGRVYITDENGVVVKQLLKLLHGFNRQSPSPWMQFSFNVCELEPYFYVELQLHFELRRNGNGKGTAMYIDNVCI
jgi:hypothetical protein